MSSSSAPIILCAGIAVQDIVFRVEQFPPPGGKCMTNEFIVVWVAVRSMPRSRWRGSAGGHIMRGRSAT